MTRLRFEALREQSAPKSVCDVWPPAVRADDVNVVRPEESMLKFAHVIVPLLLISLLSSSCSVLMVASRSSYRGDIKVIQIGVQRSVVIAELGEPDNYSTLENGGYDDRYVLDPDAHSGVTKFFTALFYAAADFFTLLLTELIFTPAELAMKDRLVVYHLTYGADGKLTAMEKIKP